MKQISLTRSLAIGQLKTAKKRTVWTLLGIALSVAMLTAVNGFVASAMAEMSSHGHPVHLRDRLGLLFIGAVLSAVIAAASIIVISNAFRVSAGERTRQFGTLKSVGATKAQIRAVIMYEALYVGIMGIPVGVAVGLAVQFTVLHIIGNMLAAIASRGVDFYLPFVVSPWALLLAVAGAFAVVLISALLPALKAAKHPAVAALFHADNIKLKKLRTLGIARFIFGEEGHLAAKQMKRSRRNYRATVLSLTISIVLLMTAASLRANLLAQWNVMHYDKIGADVIFNARRSAGDIPPEIIAAMTARMEAFPGTVVRGYSHMLFCTYIDGEQEYIRVMSVAPDMYSRIVREAGVPYGSNILLNVRNNTDTLGITRQTHPLGHIVGQTLTVSPATSFGYYGNRYAESPPDLHIHGQIRHVPDEILFTAYFEISIIVPEFPIGSYYWFIRAENVDEFVDYAFALRDEFFWGPDGLGNMGSFIGRLDQRNAEIRTLTNVVSLLVYGFTAMLTLIALTNLVSTVSTNTKIRAREFAILISVGMTPSGIRRMLALESIISSARSLVFGLPLGTVAAWLVYAGTQMDRVRFGFIFPWEMAFMCMAGVFVITFAVTRFSASRFGKESVVETIRRG